MNLLHSGEEPISIDPRWLVEQSDHGVDELGFWARPFANETSLLRIDFFDPVQVPAFFDGMCRLSAKDRKGVRGLQLVAPAMRLFGPGGVIDKECLATSEALEFIVPFAVSVPQPLRRLVGRFPKAQQQWRVLDIFQQYLELGEKLPDQEAWVAEVLRLWLHHSYNVSLPDLVDKIMRGKRRQVLQCLIPFPVGQKHVRCLARLDPVLSDRGKDIFWCIAQRENRFRALQHMDHITDQVLKDLWRVPYWIEVVNPKVFKFADTEVLEHLSTLQQYQCFGPVPDEVATRARSANSKRDLLALGFAVEFPESPVSGDDLLEPIADPKALKRAGRELRNCVAELIQEVVDGRTYFLLWKGKRPGLVQIGRGRNGGWKFVQAFGVRNSRLHRSTIKAIKRRLGRMGL